MPVDSIKWRRSCLNSPSGSTRRNWPPSPGQRLFLGRNGSDTCWSILVFAAKVSALKEFVREHAKQSTVLLPKAPQKRSHRNKGWKLYVNAKVEAEL